MGKNLALFNLQERSAQMFEKFESHKYFVCIIEILENLLQQQPPSVNWLLEYVIHLYLLISLDVLLMIFFLALMPTTLGCFILLIFSRAFDAVNHKSLLAILRSFDFSVSIVSLMQSNLSHHSQEVVVLNKQVC